MSAFLKMELKEMSIPMETTTASAVLKPTTVIANTISKEYLKITELKEYCKFAECGLKEYESEIQALLSSLNESSKIIADYKRRNKINATNYESLLQAKNELYKYKCELKSSYIATEKALKSKKLKYEKIISSYECKWQIALKEFNANPVVAELQRVEEENTNLKVKIEKLERLKLCTEEQFVQLKEHLHLMLSKKIVEFSEAMIQYKETFITHKRNKERASSKHKKAQQNFEFKLFKEAPGLGGKRSPASENNDDFSSFSSIDVSIFDDIMIPPEDLESQHLEEDVYSTSQNKELVSDTSKDQEEDLEGWNKLKEQQLVEDERAKKSLDGTGENSVQSDGKAMESESRYFQVSECSKQGKVARDRVTESSKVVDDNSEKLKLLNCALEVSQKIQENEELSREPQMEYDDLPSEGSSDNQMGNQREIYDCQYRKTSSFSSDEFPLVENVNGPFGEEETNLFKSGDPEKNDFKSFTGFFTMGNEHNSSKPSFFKLF